MTVETQVTKVSAVGNGIATSFSFAPIVILQSSDLLVTHLTAAGVETVLTEGTDYTVVPLTAYPSTGSVTCTEIATGDTIVMKRVLVIQQTMALDNQGGYFADTQETAFDTATMIDLQQQELIDRSLKGNIADTVALNDLPVASVRANLYVGFDSAGQVIAVEAVTLAQLQAQYAATGNVPLPSAGQVGHVLGALATGVFGWTQTLAAPTITGTATFTGRALMAGSDNVFVRGDSPLEVRNVTGVADPPLLVIRDMTLSANLTLPTDYGVTVYGNDSNNASQQLASFFCGWLDNTAATGRSFVGLHANSAGGTLASNVLIGWAGGGVCVFPADKTAASDPGAGVFKVNNGYLLVHKDLPASIPAGHGAVGSGASDGLELMGNGGAGGYDLVVYNANGVPILLAPHATTDLQVGGNISAASGIALTKYYDSGVQTITAAGALTLAHGLGAAPKFVEAYLENVTAEQGYSVGDVVLASIFPVSASNAGAAVKYDATNIYIRFGSATNTFFILNDTTGAVASIVNANWKIKFVAAA